MTERKTEKNNGKSSDNLKLFIWGFGVIFTIVTAAMVIGAQNEKLNATIREQSAMRETVRENAMAVRELNIDISYIREGIDEIKEEVSQ